MAVFDHLCNRLVFYVIGKINYPLRRRSSRLENAGDQVTSDATMTGSEQITAAARNTKGVMLYL